MAKNYVIYAYFTRALTRAFSHVQLRMKVDMGRA